jgi:transcriptional regulator GlxA family with amidase domain
MQRWGFLCVPPCHGLLPLAAAVDALHVANGLLESHAYAPLLLRLGDDAGTVAGVPFHPPALNVATLLAAAPPLDALVLVAERMPEPAQEATCLAELAPALARVAERGGVLVGIGTGAAWLALAGQLRGHRCTVQAAHVAELAARQPELVISNHLYEIDRQRLSCAGGAASLDLMVAWLGSRHGERLAQRLLEHFGLERLRGRDERQLLGTGARLAGSPKLAEAVALMEANVAEPLSTEDVARLVGVSRRQLERLFKQQLDTLPSRWYLELRLARARRLLQQSSQSILQIGLSCGFSSAPHFSNAYRSHYGRTPRDERSTRAAAWRAAPREATPDAPPFVPVNAPPPGPKP